MLVHRVDFPRSWWLLVLSHLYRWLLQWLNLWILVWSLVHAVRALKRHTSSFLFELRHCPTVHQLPFQSIRCFLKTLIIGALRDALHFLEKVRISANDHCCFRKERQWPNQFQERCQRVLANLCRTFQKKWNETLLDDFLFHLIVLSET